MRSPKKFKYGITEKYMGKILALDIGEKRIGYAVSDESQKMAFPRGFFAIRPFEKTFERLRGIAREEGISQIVIGVPLGEDNEDTKSSIKIRRFGGKLARELMLPICYVDEFGSTDEALAKIPFRKDRRERGGDDSIAAQIILQRYLDGGK